MRTRFIYNSLHAAFLLVGQMRLQCPGMRSGVVVMAALTAALLMSMPARSDYAAGQEAWEAGRIAEALSEWEAAAAEGDVRAMMTLGRAYQRGVGAPQDYILAHFWFNLAASQDDFRAAAERDSLAELMSVEEKAAARKLLREWRGKVQPTVEVDVSDQAPSATAPDVGAPPPRAIKEAQSLLAQLGYAPGPADGIWGKRTSEAYRAFLGDAELPVTETLTPKALRILREIAVRQGEAEQPEQTVATQIPTDALHRAAKAGDLDGLHASLEAGADINRLDKQGWTALMHAVNKGNVLIVEALVEAGADLDVRAADGATALFMSAVLGDPQIVAQLMKAGADISVQGPRGKTAVDVARLTFGELDATSANDADLAVVGLQRGRTWEETLARQSAAKEAAKEFVALFGREPSADAVDEYGRTDLHLAADANLVEVAKLLINHGADVSIRDYSGWAPIDYAASKNSVEMAKLLINHGADANVRRGAGGTLKFNGGGTPLYFAAWNNSVAVAKLLIDHGADVNVRDDDGDTPLYYAAWNNSVAVAKLFINHGADVNERDNDGGKPIIVAVANNFVEMAKLLIDHGADVNVRGEFDSVALILAARDNSVEMVKLLIDHGADVNVRTSNGWAPMFATAFWNSVEAAKLLIDHGADVNVRDDDGDTPLQLAKQRSNEEMVTLLRQFTNRIENGSQNSNR